MCNSWLALNYVKDNNDNIYDITNNDKGNIVYYIIIIIMIITLVSIFKSNWFTVISGRLPAGNLLILH